MNEREIFAAALERPTGAQRQAFLDEVCDDAMRPRVERLLKEQGQLGSFLEHPPLEEGAAALDGIDATILQGDGSTRDDDEGAVRFPGEHDVKLHPQEEDDGIPLGFLKPATRADSLGRLGHYDILQVVGRGAFGTVLRAFDEKLERIVAIKVLAPEMAATSPARKRFLREARTAAAVRHENVVAIYAVEDEPIPYLVMEYIPGKTLQERLDEQGPLDLANVLRLGKQIADGLAAAHEQGLIHRDIKPGNILLEGGMDERVKITDFGLARTADDASMTQSGVIAGTPMYMAPEQAHGDKLDQRADLFSFGSVLYQMLSGRPPFRARTTMAVLKRVTEDAPRPIQEIIPETPAWMCELIGHLHAKNPGERYGSAREVSELLAQCALDLQAGRVPKIPDPSKAANESVEDSPAPVKTSRDESLIQRPLFKVAAAVLILLGALGITEATGVTKFAATVIRLTTGSGTLVIETDDPSVKIAINGEEVTIRGGGVEELTLRPGEYKVAALKNGQPVKQELVSITRNGRKVVRMSLEKDAETQGGHLSTGESVNLIALINPKRDFLDDRLRLQNGKIVTPDLGKTTGAMGMIPFGPVPANYDIELQLQRVSHKGAGFNMGILVDGRQVLVAMDGGRQGQFGWGLDYLDDLAGYKPENPTNNPGQRFLIGETSDVSIQVRDNHVTAICDGETLIDWQGNPARLSLWRGYKPSRKDSLFFVGQAGFIVHKMELIPGGASATKEAAGWHGWPADAPLPAIAPFKAAEAKAHQQAWAKYLGVPVEKQIDLGKDKDGQDITLTMVLIPPGEFMMGTTDGEVKKWLDVAKAGNPNGTFDTIGMERPQHFVRITKPFWLSKAEFSKAQFRRFVEGSGGYKTDAETNGKGGTKPVYSTLSVERDPKLNWDNWGKAAVDDSPVVNVSWNDAAKCCEWLSRQHPELTFSLPTEAQWEYACRAGTKNSLYDCETSEELRQYAQFGSEVNFIQRCGLLRPNAFGLYDMLGNVTELCSDWMAGYRNSTTDDPAGPATPGKYAMRAVRGGSFIHQAWHVRSTKRNFSEPDNCFCDQGFRVAAAIRDDGKTTTVHSPEGKPSFNWPADAPPAAIAPFDAKQAKAHQAAWAKHLGVPVEYTNSIGMKFRLIPPGEFLMGSTPEEIEVLLESIGKDKDNAIWRDYIRSEAPQHRVILTQPVYVGVTEVTQTQYEQVMGANPSHFSATGEGKEAVANLKTGNHPVETVSWIDATKFCVKLSQQENLKPFYLQFGNSVRPLSGTGYRLPTEAEWEHACRAGTTTRFWNCDEEQDLNQAGWSLGNSVSRTHAVGELKANPFGLSDVHGNVWEWVQDGWDPAFYGKFKENAAVDPSSPFSDGAQRRVVRGGCWGNYASNCRSSYREALFPTIGYNCFGFRMVLSVDAVKQRPSPFTDADVERIAALPAEQQIEEVRQELIRRNLGFDGEVKTRIVDGVVTELLINTDRVTDIAPIRVFNSLQALKCLGTVTNFKGNGQLADLTVLHDMNLTELRHLDLSNTRVSDADLAIFKQCRNLTVLYLVRTHVTDAGLACFQGCKSIEVLDLSNMPEVNGSGLASFRDCHNLTTLSLRKHTGERCRAGVFQGLLEPDAPFVGLDTHKRRWTGQFQKLQEAYASRSARDEGRRQGTGSLPGLQQPDHARSPIDAGGQRRSGSVQRLQKPDVL